jgi:hypothetical protein
MGKIALRVSPFIILGGILAYTWIIIFSTEYMAMARHIALLFLFLINLVVYFFRFRLALIGTGVILLLATSGFLGLLPDIETNSFGIRLGSLNIKTPGINWESLALLIVYLVVNGGYLVDVYFEYKERKYVKK